MMSRKRKLAAAVVAKIILKRRRVLNITKICWVKQWIDRRCIFGVGSALIRELKIEDSQQFRSFCRLTSCEMEYIIESIGPAIYKKDTVLRKAISVHDRVMVTLRFLASGDSYDSLQYLFRIPVCTIGRKVKEVCPAIYTTLKTKYLKFPETIEGWLEIAEEFESRWNFPHCIGSLDGKHITIQAPKNAGSHYYNYKGAHSIVLMAIVDANYKFIFIDVGCNGRISDGGVFSNCSLYNGLTQNTIRLPDSRPLPGRDMSVPYCFVADDAFAMKTYILKPYPFRDQPVPNRIFNYRLSRARRIVENAFGIISNKFRFLRKPMLLNPNRARDVVMVICALHNFLLSKNNSNYLNKGLIDIEDQKNHEIIQGNWRSETQYENTFFQLERRTRHNYSVSQRDVKDEFKNYFMITRGEVLWQYRHITF